jgi:hypothetical protein
MSMERHGGMTCTGEPTNSEKKPVLMSLCPPSVLDGLTLERTLAAAVKGR